jgi:spermidine synthase
VPGGAEELRLYKHDRDFIIALDRNELMSSRMSGSEMALATIAGRKKPYLLIGGYGMGFTLRAALAKLDKDARITVAELVPEVIEWARGPMVDLAAGCLEDPRVDLVIGDVGALIASCTGSYDAILLDVDNGPDGLTCEDNAQLYTKQGLRAARAALKPGGILAVWSATKDPPFTGRLVRAGFEVEEVGVRARSNGKGPMHVIWFAKTPA